MMAPAEDGPGLDALRAGDRRAQEQFWRLHWDRTYATCARVLGYGADATDVATDVLHDFLYRHVHHVVEARAVRTYLGLAATRRALRRRERAGRHVELEAEQLPDEGARAPDRAAWTALLLPRLGACLEGLTPKAQQVLKLRFGGELTNERIGELVGGSKQYIGRLIKESAERLRACLEAGRGDAHALA